MDIKRRLRFLWCDVKFFFTNYQITSQKQRVLNYESNFIDGMIIERRKGYYWLDKIITDERFEEICRLWTTEAEKKQKQDERYGVTYPNWTDLCNKQIAEAREIWADVKKANEETHPCP